VGTHRYELGGTTPHSAI